MVLQKKDSEKYVLFSQEKKVEEEVWTGYKIGSEKAKSFYLADTAYNNNQIDKLSELILSSEKIYYDIGSSKKIDNLILKGIENFKSIKSRTGKPNPQIIDPSVKIDSMRLIKSDNEIELMQEAIDLTQKGFMEAFKFSTPGVYEKKIIKKYKKKN